MSKTETDQNDALSKATAKADRLSQALLLALIENKMAAAGIAASNLFATYAAKECRLVQRGGSYDVDVVTDQGEVRRLQSGALYPVDHLIADYTTDERFAAYFAEHPIVNRQPTAAVQEKKPEPEHRPITSLTRSAFEALGPSERMAYIKGSGRVTDDPAKPQSAPKVQAGSKILTRSSFGALSHSERSQKLRDGFTLVDD